MDGDARRPTSATAETARPGLSRDRIIATAIDFIDERGLTALTMRRLGNELGVEAMSLYRYVNGREDLLEGIVDRMVAELHLRSEMPSSPPPRAGRPTCNGSPTASARWLATTRRSSR